MFTLTQPKHKTAVSSFIIEDRTKRISDSCSAWKIHINGLLLNKEWNKFPPLLNKVIFFILWVGGELMVCFLAKTPCNSPILCIFSCWFQIWNPFLPVIKNEKAQGHQRFFLKIMTFFCIFAIYWPFFKIPGWNLGGIFFISHL